MIFPWKPTAQAGQHSGGSLPERQAERQFVCGVPEVLPHLNRTGVGWLLLGAQWGIRPYECHNPVTGLSAPFRILCRLTSGKCHHAAEQEDRGQRV